MKRVIVFAAIIAYACCSPASRRGACIIVCGENGITCPLDYSCLSNGCGRECKRVTPQPSNCPLMKCELHCSWGYERDANGCDICKCNFSMLQVATG